MPGSLQAVSLLNSSFFLFRLLFLQYPVPVVLATTFTAPHVLFSSLYHLASCPSSKLLSTIWITFSLCFSLSTLLGLYLLDNV